VNGVIGTVMTDSTAEVTEVLTEEVAAAIVNITCKENVF
jgi:hypothetical protein